MVETCTAPQRVKGSTGCPVFGTWPDPGGDHKCRACHLQLQCIEALSGAITVKDAELLEGFGLVKWLDEVAEDMRPIVGEICTVIGESLEQSASPKVAKVQKAITSLLEEEGILDPWVAEFTYTKATAGWEDRGDGVLERKTP